MRNNLPVSNQEYDLSDHETIVSTTDLQGNITYANPYFIEVSGFTEGELIGAPQNIVRHPDMPSEAFADLWATIKQGRAWTGMVKNRCKNGDHYWVVANHTPVIEDGQAVGYMSLRTKPGRAQVQAAQLPYQQIRSGNVARMAIEQGVARPTGLMAKWNQPFSISLNARITLNLAALIVALMLLTLSNLGLFDDGKHHPMLHHTMLAVDALACFLAVFFWYSLQQSLLHPLRQALAACQTMAGGDMTLEIRTERQDEIGQLLRSLRQLLVNLHSIIGDVRHNFDHVGTASREIMAGNSDLSARTEAQASALEQTASSMEQLASTVQLNSDHVTKANPMAAQASEVAAKGGAIVNQVVTQMDQVTQQNAALVEQAAAAAGSMQHQTVKVTQALTSFKLERKRQVLVTLPAPRSATRQLAR